MTRYAKGEGRLDEALVTASPSADFGDVLRRGSALVRQRHGGTEDFTIDNQAAEVLSNLAMADNILGGWNAVMFTIAGVTLIVGGIGLFSVLLISVRERVHEIGIRKALGADDGAIVKLFLAESLTLAFLGSVLGIAGGAGLTVITELIGKQFPGEHSRSDPRGGFCVDRRVVVRVVPGAPGGPARSHRGYQRRIVRNSF